MKKTISYPLVLPLAIGILGSLMVPSLHAVNNFWDNVGTDWSTDSNWSGTGYPDTGGDLAIFSTAAVTNPNLSQSESIARLTANSSSAQGYTLTSDNTGISLTLGTNGIGTGSAINYTPTTGTFTIDAPVVFGAASSTTQSVNVNAASSAVYGNVILNGPVTTTNSITLDKTGGGRLTLSSSSNAWSGNMQVSEGTLAMSGSGVLGSGNLVLNGGTFDISGISGSSFSHSAALIGSGTVAGGGNTLSVNGLDADVSMTLSNVTLALGGITSFDFTDPSLAVGTYDLVEGADSSIVFAGLLALNFSGGEYSLGDSVQIFDVGDYSGDFTGIDVSGLADGQSVEFNALTGTISIIPESKSSASLLGLAMLLLMLRRSRR